MVEASPIIHARREHPRISVEVMCSEHDDESERHAMILDFSESGLRMQRPIGGPRLRTVQLEFGIPGVDEILWAQGEICFDELWQRPPAGPGELSGILRTSGIRIVAAASRHQRLLREFVNDSWRAARAENLPDSDWLLNASCYARG